MSAIDQRPASQFAGTWGAKPLAEAADQPDDFQWHGARYYRAEWHKDVLEYLDEKEYLDHTETEAWLTKLTDGYVYATKKIPPLDNDGLAFLACNDRYFMLTRMLGRADVNHPWLWERCREVEEAPDGHLDLWAREHYKSTIITFAGVVQEIVRNPEITIGIFSNTKSIAEKFLFQIKNELESNERLITCFPDVFYDDIEESPSWSLINGIIVRRKTNPKESTVEAWGLVDSQPTGRHFQLLIYDDVVTQNSVTNPEMVKKTTEAWELSDNLGAGMVRKWTIGTRYSFADTYGIMLERNIFTPRIYPATHNGRMDGKPVFMDPARWEEKKATQRSTVSAQMLQNPLAGKEQMFMPAWFRPWQVRPHTLNVFIMCDPSKGRSSTSDRTAIAVVGIDSAGNKYLLDGYRHRMPLSERWQSLKALYIKWIKAPGVQFVGVGYERYGQQTDEEYFQEKMALEADANFPIKELNWTRDGTQSKKDRVERLEPDFRLSKFYLPAVVHEPGLGNCLWSVDEDKGHVVTRKMQKPTRDMQQMLSIGHGYRNSTPILRKDEDGKPYDLTRALMEEMLFFPFAPKDDLVDALSRIYDMEATPPLIYEDKAVANEPVFADS